MLEMVLPKPFLAFVKLTTIKQDAAQFYKTLFLNQPFNAMIP